MSCIVRWSPSSPPTDAATACFVWCLICLVSGQIIGQGYNHVGSKVLNIDTMIRSQHQPLNFGLILYSQLIDSKINSAQWGFHDHHLSKVVQKPFCKLDKWFTTQNSNVTAISLPHSLKVKSINAVQERDTEAGLKCIASYPQDKVTHYSLILRTCPWYGRDPVCTVFHVVRLQVIVLDNDMLMYPCHHPIS